MVDPRELSIEADVTHARTLPAAFYREAEWFERTRERVFARAWHWIEPPPGVDERTSVHPLTLLDGVLSEPLMLARDEQGELRCLSNVCTHRGKVLIEQAGRMGSMRCPYHGRRFALDGRLKSAPGFEDARDFPAESDHLARLPLERLGPLQFTSLAPGVAFDAWIGPLLRRLAWLPVERLEPLPERSRDYLVRAHWALYVDNYLEGLHIPFVHPSLARALDNSGYRTELLPWGSLEIGIAADGVDAFDVPSSDPDFGRGVGGYYAWLFPNTMLNFYPWGLSLNVVEPRSRETCMVKMRSFAWDETKLDRGAGSNLHQVELEDERMVESVQQGIRSRLYERGRFSPSRERAVHHFHRRIEATLASERGLWPLPPDGAAR